MPIVEVTLIEGRSPEKKRNMMRAVSQAVAETLEVRPEAVRVIIREIPKENFAVGGDSPVKPQPA